MGFKALWQSAAAWWAQRNQPGVCSEEPLPSCVTSFAKVVVGDPDFCQAFRHLSDAEPLRRRDIVTSWLRQNKTMAEADIDNFGRLLADDQGFVEILGVLQHMDPKWSVAKTSSHPSRLAS
jgi:hypothetical protein